MRIVHSPQMSFGQVDISKIKLDPRSRDDIPTILVGLQYIYTTPELHDSIFSIIEQLIPKQRGNLTDDKKESENVSSTSPKVTVLLPYSVSINNQGVYSLLGDFVSQECTCPVKPLSTYSPLFKRSLLVNTTVYNGFC